MKAAICILALEMALAVRFLMENPVAVTRTEEEVILEQRMAGSDEGNETAIYGIKFRLKEGEISFYRILIN